MSFLSKVGQFIGGAVKTVAGVVTLNAKTITAGETDMLHTIYGSNLNTTAAKATGAVLFGASGLTAAISSPAPAPATIHTENSTTVVTPKISPALIIVALLGIILLFSSNKKRKNGLF